MKQTWKQKKIAKLLEEYDFNKVASVMTYLGIHKDGRAISAEMLRNEVILMFASLDGTNHFVAEYQGLNALYVNDEVHKAIKLSFEIESLQYVKTKEMRE
jgi:hypothetical protein